MDTEASKYIPQCFKSFQGFSVLDIKENRSTEHMEIILESNKDRKRICNRCGTNLGIMKDRYWVTARHLRVFNWTVSVVHPRKSRHFHNNIFL